MFRQHIISDDAEGPGKRLVKTLKKRAKGRRKAASLFAAQVTLFPIYIQKYIDLLLQCSIIRPGPGDVAKASHHGNWDKNTRSISSYPHVEFVSANFAADRTDRGRCPYDGLDMLFRVSNRQTG
jgi:hypothetical protein